MTGGGIKLYTSTTGIAGSLVAFGGGQPAKQRWNLPANDEGQRGGVGGYGRVFVKVVPDA